MKNYYFTLITLLTFSNLLLFSQQTPIDFSDSSHEFTAWGGSSFTILPSPTDPNNPTGEFFRSSSTSEQGCYIDLTRPINLDIEDEITLRFHAFDPNSHTIVVKLENGTNPNVEVSQTTVSQFTWTDLTFDFSTVGGSGSYDRLVIKIDEGSSTPGAFRIDDINDGSVVTVDVVYDDLVWSDEFDTPGAVDSDNWFHQTQVIVPGVGWANGEAQHYTNRIDNSFVDTNGFLNIVAKKETFIDQNLQKEYTSARLNSKFAFTYGRVDVRAKLPLGEGTWPAIWMLGKNINENGGFWDSQFGTTDWPACGEIDIMEHGIYELNEVGAALHTTCCNGGNPNKGTVFASDVANDFHIYSVNWSPDQMTFLLDGEIFYIYNPSNKTLDNWPFYEDQYLLLNVAMGGVAEPIDPLFSESSMVIDYVRVYQNTALSTAEVKAKRFKVFPNPASETITIVTKEIIEGLEIYNVFGSLVKKSSSESESKKRIDVSDLSPGIYLLNIYSNSQKITKKIVVN